jgi:Ser/Thr protein kinase RdoA (MazF antagonist)
MSVSAWGGKDTQFFYNLTPDRVLDAVEASTGFRCTGRSFALNSMENRVYELEIELDEKPKNPSDRFVIAKFYRPGRWTKEQILDEHKFLFELVDSDIPVIAPLTFLDGESLHTLKEFNIYYAVFPKCGGRSPDEIEGEDLERVGRLLARIHKVGQANPATHRIAINTETYGINSLKFLFDAKLLPPEIESNYRSTVESICKIAEPFFRTAPIQRIHGDCHMGNLLFGREGYFFVDFDDMVMGPAVQDFWLLIAGRDESAMRRLNTLLDAYESFCNFDRASLKLIEPLRALRFVHFSAWIGKRWKDPSFPKAFPDYGTARYWQEQLNDLQQQLSLIRNFSWDGTS